MRTLLAIAVVLLIASPSWAGGSTKVFPLSGERIPSNLSDAPEVMTAALAKQLRGDIARTSIDDAAGLLGCDIDQAICLEQVARSLNPSASRIVFGKITARQSSGVTVALTWWDKEGIHDRKLVLVGENTDELVDELGKATRNLFEKSTKVTRDPSDVDPDETLKPTSEGNGGILDDAPTPKDEPKQGGGVTTGTWAMLIGGIAVAGVGGGFLVSAQSLAKQVRDSDPKNEQDFLDLKAIEKAGIQRTQIGAGLVIGGGVIAAIGVVRMIVQKKHAGRERSSITVTPENGGASLVFSWRLQ
jgi:hypothetical protein